VSTAWADSASGSARRRRLFVETLRHLRRDGRLVVAAGEQELRVGLRRGHAIDTRAVAELLLASRVLDDSPALREAA